MDESWYGRSHNPTSVTVTGVGEGFGAEDVGMGCSVSSGAGRGVRIIISKKIKPMAARSQIRILLFLILRNDRAYFLLSIDNASNKNH